MENQNIGSENFFEKNKKLYFLCNDEHFNKQNKNAFHKLKGRFYQKNNQWIFPLHSHQELLNYLQNEFSKNNGSAATEKLIDLNPLLSTTEQNLPSDKENVVPAPLGGEGSGCIDDLSKDSLNTSSSEVKTIISENISPISIQNSITSSKVSVEASNYLSTDNLSIHSFESEKSMSQVSARSSDNSKDSLMNAVRPNASISKDITRTPVGLSIAKATISPDIVEGDELPRDIQLTQNVTVSDGNGPSVNGPTVNGPTVNGPTVNGPTVNGPTIVPSWNKKFLINPPNIFYEEFKDYFNYIKDVPDLCD
jgi:hypothetical protein